MLFTPGHSPGHVTYAIAAGASDREVTSAGESGRVREQTPGERALLSGDVLFAGSVGRTDLPGGDWNVLERSIGTLLRAFPAETAVYPGHMGTTTLGRERDTNPFLAELRVPVERPATGEPVRAGGARRGGPGSRKLSRGEQIKAPRGTFDVLGSRLGVRASLEASARKILEGAGYERIETPALEATELFARGVGASTDIVQKEMFTLDDGGGRSLTLRPEGTAPVCRAYVEHGMHKRKQPVKLWYLSSFFRHERAQAGRYRQFWQVGAEALGSEDPAVDAESIVLLAALLEEMGVREVRLRLSSLGGKESRGEYRELLQAHLREHEASLSDEVKSRIELNPLRAFDSDHEGTKRVMESAPRLLDHLSVQDSEHFAQVRELLDLAEVPYEVDPTLVRGLDYYTRTVFEFTSDALGAQSGVGGGGRYDGLVEKIKGPSSDGSSTPGIGWAAGVERILLAGEPAPVATSPLDLFVALGEQEGRVRRDGRGSICRIDGPDGAGGTLAEGSTGPSKRARCPLRRDRRAGGDGAEGHAGGRAGDDPHGHCRARRLARFAHPLTVQRVLRGSTLRREMPKGERWHSFPVPSRSPSRRWCSLRSCGSWRCRDTARAPARRPSPARRLPPPRRKRRPLRERHISKV